MKPAEKQRPARLGGALISTRVAARLLQELTGGRYAHDDRLPPEVELAGALQVSRTVVRDALSELERGGYIERVRGIGTVVNRGVVRLQDRMDRKLEFTRLITATGHTPHTDHLLVTRQAAEAETAEKLGIQEGQTVLVISKRMLADDIPVLFCTDVLPMTLFDSTKPDTIDFARPIFDVLQEECGVQTTSTVTRLRAVKPRCGGCCSCRRTRRCWSWTRCVIPACAGRWYTAGRCTPIILILPLCASWFECIIICWCAGGARPSCHKFK